MATTGNLDGKRVHVTGQHGYYKVRGKAKTPPGKTGEWYCVGLCTCTGKTMHQKPLTVLREHISVITT